MNFVNLNATAAKPDDYARAAGVIGCEPAVFRAVVAVETGGRGFDSKGRLRALFEPHVFYRLLAMPNRGVAIRAGLAYRQWGTQPYPRDSYPRILAACGVDEEFALRATSWGLPQILGLNHKAAGYESAAAMVAAFVEGEDEQLDAMARFIVAKDLATALARKDWAAFARGYNGRSYAKNAYDRKLARGYAHFKVGHPMAVMIASLPSPVPIPSTSGSEPAPRTTPTLWRRVASTFRR